MYYDEYKDCAFCGTTFHTDNNDLVFFEDINVNWNSDEVIQIYTQNVGHYENSEHLCHDCVKVFLEEVKQASEKQRVFPRMLDNNHL